MQTYFAPPEKASQSELDLQVKIVNASPVLSGLLNSVSGLLAVLNEQRQIIALNDSFLRTIGIDDPIKALGLRHGEAFHCSHSDDEPAGCGTTKFCSTCGAAIAIVSSMVDKVPVERLCAITARRDGKTVDIALLVRSQTVIVGGSRLILLLVHDVTVEQRRAALERTFFHDINNMLFGLQNLSEIVAEENPSKAANNLLESVRRLNGEIAIQGHLSSSESIRYRATWCTCNSNEIISQLKSFFVHHPAGRNKTVEWGVLADDEALTTDNAALFRVLTNMILNALEATREGGVVKVWIERQEHHVKFCVWNQGVIPDEIGRRLFQRNFSTKAESGRGIGTFSMKLLGEEVLGGQVGFTSSLADGTVFSFIHPGCGPRKDA